MTDTYTQLERSVRIVKDNEHLRALSERQDALIRTLSAENELLRARLQIVDEKLTRRTDVPSLLRPQAG